MTNKGEYGYFRHTPSSLRWLRSVLDDSAMTVVFHNAKFDLTMLMMEEIDIFSIKAKVECTMILSKLFNMNGVGRDGSHKLEDLGRYCLNRDTTDKNAITDWLKARNTKRHIRDRGRKLGFHDVPDEIVQRRCLWDVETTILLWHYFRPRVQQTCESLFQNELALQYVCIDMENHGVQVDITRAKELKAQAIRDIEQMSKELNHLLLPLTVQRKRKGEDVDEVIVDEFNVNSQPQKVAAWQKLGIKLRYKTKPKKKGKGGQKVGGGNWAFDEYAMMRYVSKPLTEVMRQADEDGWESGRFQQAIRRVVKTHGLNKRELVPPFILRIAQLKKMISTYYDKIIYDSVAVEVTPTGREIGTLHCQFNQSEALTGRFSSSDPNLQNIPRILGPRECFIPRRGRRNWHVDYEQVEMKFFVHFAQDKDMAKAIEDDIHLYTATKIYRKPETAITKEQRKRAKATNFGIIYGSGPETQAETLTERGLPTTVQEAKRLVMNYHREFPSVRRLTNALKIELHRKGFVTNPHGRRYHIDKRFAYKALNYLCQGTSADEIKLAMVKIWQWLRKMGLKTKIIMVVHDEIVLEVPRVEERRVIPAVKRIMENHHSYFVPITVDFEVASKRWSKKQNPRDVGCSFAA